MTRQETFEIVSRHLLTQNEKALSNERCVYRSANGLKCAAGCLIPDDKYNPSLEGHGVPSTSPNFSCKTQTLWDILTEEGHDVPLVHALQRIHDLSLTESWCLDLTIFAEKFGLSTDFFEDI